MIECSWCGDEVADDDATHGHSGSYCGTDCEALHVEDLGEEEGEDE